MVAIELAFDSATRLPANTHAERAASASLE